MLTIDGLHTRESNGNHALIVANGTAYRGKILYRNKTQEELVELFGKFCTEIIIGTDRTIFEFDKAVSQDTLNEFTKLFENIFNFTNAQ